MPSLLTSRRSGVVSGGLSRTSNTMSTVAGNRDVLLLIATRSVHTHDYYSRPNPTSPDVGALINRMGFWGFLIIAMV